MSELFNIVRDYLKTSFNNEAQLRHFDRTVDWVKELKPDADDALLIAAIGHDIERAFRHPTKDVESTGKSFADAEHFGPHQDEGARILGDFLRKNQAEESLIKRVQHLVSKHEVGGDEDQNLLKDADSLSFLENNADIFLARLDKLGYEKVKEKFDRMFERISSPKARGIGRPYYEKMIKELDEIAKTKGLIH